MEVSLAGRAGGVQWVGSRASANRKRESRGARVGKGLSAALPTQAGRERAHAAWRKDCEAWFFPCRQRESGM